jgi:protein MpaA
LLSAGYGELTAAWRGLRGTGLRVREVACVGAPRTLLLVESGTAGAPAISLSAGMHGDEPAGAWALYAIARDGLLDPRFAYRIWPCCNPTGLDAGTRESVDGIDINRTFGRGGRSPEAKAMLAANRDRRFALTVDLHEDHEADGFYLYETAPAGWQSRYAGPVTAHIRDAGFPLQTFGPDFDLGPPGTEAAQQRGPGTVLVDADAERPFYGANVPLGLVQVVQAARCALTFETPRRAAFDARVEMHRVAVVSALVRAAALP